MFKVRALLALLLALSAPAQAQPATLVADLATDLSLGDGSSNPARFWNAGGKLFFTAFQSTSGRGLYVTDGTGAGTHRLTDVCPGACDLDATPFAEVHGLLLFSTVSSLWRTDGTRAGTYPLTAGSGAPLQLGPGASRGFATLDGQLYFTASSPGAGRATIWRTDGSQAGTANVEVMTKVLDGTGLNGKFWFFYGALSNVEYTLTVTDTQTGAIKAYKNPSGQFGSVADTGAF